MVGTRSEIYTRLNIESEEIPVGASNRPGRKIMPRYITIHNTDNARAGANALAHARYLRGDQARRRKVSWHFTVDDTRCVKHLPLSEMGWHAGRGNVQSVGIEICENTDGNLELALERAALLVALLMQTLSIPLINVVPHQFWTGKFCPRRILELPNGFDGFRIRCAAFLTEMDSKSNMMFADENESPAGGPRWGEDEEEIFRAVSSNCPICGDTVTEDCDVRSARQ